MEPAIQYDLFEQIDPVQEELARMRDSLRRTQKRLFAEQGELMKHILRLERENEALAKRLDKVTKGMIKIVE